MSFNLPTPVNQHELNDDNYYSQEAGKKYLSVHALMSYLKDPSLFWLKGNGYLKNTSSDAADAGRIFHAFVNTKEEFAMEMQHLGKKPFSLGRKKIDNEEVLAMIWEDPSQLTPKAPFEAVWSFVVSNWQRREELWAEVPYFKELILTGRIGDAPFKGRLDVLRIEGENAYIYDYKTLGLKENYGNWKDPDGNWHKKTFIHEYNYDLQMTAYAELVKQNFPQVKEVFIQFGILVKSVKHDFTEIPTSFIETEIVNVRDMSTNRFDGDMPITVLMDNALKAHYALNLDYEKFTDIYGKSLMMEIALNSDKKLKFEDFRLK